MLGRPEPMINGAMVICSRCRQPAARNRDTVIPPPSTNTRRSPAPGQKVEDRSGSQASVLDRDADHLRLAQTLMPVHQVLGAQDQRSRRAIREDAIVALEPPPRIQHHSGRISARHQSDRQLRVVVADGAGADHHRVEQRAHAMIVRNVLGPGDPARAAIDGRDAAIQALPQVGDDERLGAVAAERRIELDQTTPFRIQSAGIERRRDRGCAGRERGGRSPSNHCHAAC